MTLSTRFTRFVQRALRSESRRSRQVSARPRLESLESRLVLDRTVLREGHADIAIGYKDEWDLHAHDDKGEYSPDEVLFYAGQNTRTTQPRGEQWEFIGAGAGNRIWVLPQVERPEVLFLGLETEEIAKGTFYADYVWLVVTGVFGPGEFSMWQTDSFGQPTVAIATTDGITDDDFFALPVGTHAHYNYGFTATGIYYLQTYAFAYDPDSGEINVSDYAYYVFGVEEDEESPAPGGGSGQAVLSFSQMPNQVPFTSVVSAQAGFTGEVRQTAVDQFFADRMSLAAETNENLVLTGESPADAVDWQTLDLVVL